MTTAQFHPCQPRQLDRLLFATATAAENFKRDHRANSRSMKHHHTTTAGGEGGGGGDDCRRNRELQHVLRLPRASFSYPIPTTAPPATGMSQEPNQQLYSVHTIVNHSHVVSLDRCSNRLRPKTKGTSSSSHRIAPEKAITIRRGPKLTRSVSNHRHH